MTRVEQSPQNDVSVSQLLEDYIIARGISYVNTGYSEAEIRRMITENFNQTYKPNQLRKAAPDERLRIAKQIEDIRMVNFTRLAISVDNE